MIPKVKTYQSPFQIRGLQMTVWISAVLLLSLTINSCKESIQKPKESNTYTQYQGRTMGTTYNIVFDTKALPPQSQTLTQPAVDSILQAINMSASTYIDSSTISKINNAKTYGQKVELIKNGQFVTEYSIDLDRDPHFITVYKAAEKLYYATDEHFDPTVMPLVNYWGFGYTPKVPVTAVDSQAIQQLLDVVGLQKFNVELNQYKMRIVKPADAQLDFSAIAKGYAVDYIAGELKGIGIQDLMVEIGGEVMAAGLSPKGKPWVIGINTPEEKAKIYDFSDLVVLDGMSMASSGNYRNYYEVDGQKYGHEINPKTGFPEKNELLGTTVIATTCMEADALATAMMVMGKTKAEAFMSQSPNIEAILFFSNEEGGIESITTEGYKAYQLEKKLPAVD